MKKLLLLSLALCIGFYANAQKQAKFPSHLLNKQEKIKNALNGEELPIILSGTNPYVTYKPAKDLGLQIGITWYDLQSNANVGNRMMVYPDGSISAVWTMTPNGTAGYPDRGTGYNHSTNGGTSWGPDPTVRLEGGLKTGWPNIGKLTDGSEVDITHTAVGGNMCKTTDGGLNWVNSEVGGSVISICWPRMVTNGNTIHVIANSTTTVPYQGFAQGALVYLRSTDGGATWSAPVIPTGLDTSNYSASIPFSDNYSIAGKGDTIAIVYGEGFRTTCLVKSTNNGTSWTYREILHLPIKKFDTEGSAIFDMNNDAQQDNLFCNDGENFVTLDKYGKAHVFFGRQKFTDDGAGAGHSWFPYTDGLYYWNEDMPTIQYQYKWTMINSTNTYEGIPDTVNFPIITEVYDINHNGIIDFPENGANYQMGYYRLASLSSMPNADIAPDGSITLFYSSIVEGTDGTVGTDHWAFRNVWETHKMASAPNNFTWSTPVRIAEDDYTEQVWPCVSPRITGTAPNYSAHLWYQGDGYPGNALQSWTTSNPHPIAENSIYYIKYLIPYDGINEINIVKSAPVIYPNPASKNVTVSYNLTDATNVTLSIYNMVGQQIMTTTKNVTSGEVNVSLNIETLPQGVYFIKSDIGNKTYTNKLVVR